MATSTLSKPPAAVVVVDSTGGEGEEQSKEQEPEVFFVRITAFGDSPEIDDKRIRRSDQGAQPRIRTALSEIQGRLWGKMAGVDGAQGLGEGTKMLLCCFIVIFLSLTMDVCVAVLAKPGTTHGNTNKKNTRACN